MSLPTNETHYLCTGTVNKSFLLHKLPYKLWSFDYLVYWNNGNGLALFRSADNAFAGLDGIYIPYLMFKEKPKDTPWTPVDIAKYIGYSLYETGGNPAGILTINKIGANGVYGMHGLHITYEDMVKNKCFVIDGVNKIPAYNKV